MAIKTHKLPQDYQSIVAETFEGFVISKHNKIERFIQVAFTNKQFEIEKELKLEADETRRYKLIINPNDTTHFGYLAINSVLSIYDQQAKLIKEFGFKCADAVYDKNGNLYTIERIDLKKVLISIFDKNLKMIDCQELEDPSFDSYIDLEYNTPLSRVFLSLAAAQDGCTYFTVDLKESKLEINYFLDSSVIIETNDKKDHILTIEPYSYTLEYYSYPQLEKISTFSYIDGLSEYEDEFCVGFSLIYLKENQFIIFTEGLQYIYDTEKLEIQSPIYFEGHLPKPTKEFYPRLATDETMMTDIILGKRLQSIVKFETLDGSDFYVRLEDLFKYE